MAIIVELPTASIGTVLNAFNDNVVTFYDDQVLNPSRAAVEYLGNVFDLYPSPSGKFYFNFKDIVPTIINSNNFKDQIVPDIQTSGYVYEDVTMFRSMDVLFVVFDQNDSSDGDLITFEFLKSVVQPMNYKDNQIQLDDDLTLLLPETYLKKEHYVSYFEGYPFDISMFFNGIEEANNVTFKNTTTGNLTSLSFIKGVNRLFTADGSVDFTIDDVLPLRYGINRIIIQKDEVNQYATLFLDKKESDCGPYLRYYAGTSGYRYFRFKNKFTPNIRTREENQIRSVGNDISESLQDLVLNTKSALKSITLSTGKITKSEMKYLEDILISPNVDLYLKDIFQKSDDSSWLNVNVKSGSFEAVGEGKSKYELKITIEIPQNTFTY